MLKQKVGCSGPWNIKSHETAGPLQRDIGAVKLRKLWQCRYQDNNCCKQHLGRSSTYWNIQATFDIITWQEVRTTNLAWLL